VSGGLDLAACLQEVAGGWPAPVESHSILGSTNDRLKDLAREGAPEWTVVVADLQSGGRGRHGNTWMSPSGNLYLSVLLRPGDAPAGLVPLLAGVGAAEALAGFGVPVALKWPNDLVAKGRKLGGLLAEAASTADALEWIVLGAGINLTAVPESLRETAVCVREIVEPPARDRLAAAVLHRWSVWYHRLREKGGDDIIAAWRERALPWWGERVRATQGTRGVEGIAQRLDREGRLVLLLDDGREEALHSGVASLVRRSG
jgi:BirA family biotin operon repressor/biotin-[acetyl-CoA-carboxylase] ligase